MNNMEELRDRLSDISSTIESVYYELSNQIEDLSDLSSDIDDVVRDMEDNEINVEEYEEQIEKYKEVLEDVEAEKECLQKRFADMDDIAQDFYKYACTLIVESNINEETYRNVLTQLTVYQRLGLISDTKVYNIMNKLTYKKEGEEQ